MTPLRGWAPKGKRLRGFAPHGHWRTLTFLGALRCDRLTAPCVFDGPINGQCFRAYVEQQLVPCSNPVTSSSWTISAPTSRPPSGRWSAPSAPGSGTCRPTRPTSTRSNRPSPRSSTGCDRRKSEPSRTPAPYRPPRHNHRTSIGPETGFCFSRNCPSGGRFSESALPLYLF